MNNYFGFAISGSMFKEDCNLQVIHLEEDRAKQYIENSKETGSLKVCLNPSHAATISAMQKKYGIEVEIPEVAPRCELQPGDNLLVLQVSGLPRLDATRHEYTEEEIESAQFSFISFSVNGLLKIR